MTVNYIALADRIANETDTHALFVGRVLRWLDEHPNPTVEPTNAEKLEKIIWASDGPVASLSLTRAELLAKWLDEAGVKAPGGDDE